MRLLFAIVLTAWADTSAPDRGLDVCQRDDDCIQAQLDEHCCHLCFVRMITRKRQAEELSRCRSQPPKKCFEGDCAAPERVPVCRKNHCVATQ
jgi:hypothetical protein